MAYCKKHKARHSHKRKSHKRKQHKQSGGGSCAAMPMNRSNFQQMGGFAPIGDAYTLLDQPTQVQAESYGQVQAIDQAVAMAKAQAGGSRRKAHRKSHRKGSRSAHRKGSRKAHRKSHRKSSRSARRKSQRGGMAPFPFANQTQPTPGANPQFHTSVEGSVNPLYNEYTGAQPWLLKA